LTLCIITVCYCIFSVIVYIFDAFSALTVFVGWEEGYPSYRTRSSAMAEGPRDALVTVD